MPYPYTIEYYPNGCGQPVAFKVYPLQEGQSKPFIAMAEPEEVKGWEAYQEAVNANHMTVQTPAPTEVVVETSPVVSVPEPSLNGTGKKVKSGSK